MTELPRLLIHLIQIFQIKFEGTIGGSRSNIGLDDFILTDTCNISWLQPGMLNNNGQKTFSLTLYKRKQCMNQSVHNPFYNSNNKLLIPPKELFRY